jgi:5-formyltetrahydrofolate cyclo-ligase
MRVAPPIPMQRRAATSLNRHPPSVFMSQSSKAEIRRRMRQRRRQIDARSGSRASLALAANLERLLLLAPGRRVAGYLANDGEIDPGQAMRRAIGRDVAWYLPVVPRRGCRRLEFARYQRGGRLRRNRFGIPEPVGPAAARLHARRLDLVLVPLVAFDDRGNRLGMGGGFYDTTLAATRRGSWRRPRIVGLAHECQRLPRLETEPWDIPLDTIVTDRAIYRFRRREDT